MRSALKLNKSARSHVPLVACVAGLLHSPVVRAQDAAASARIRGQGAHLSSHADPDAYDLDGELTAGVDLAGIVAPSDVPVGYVVGMHYRFGLGLPASAFYEATISPVGIGLLFARDGWLGLLVGAGFQGAAGELKFEGRFPATLRWEMNVAEELRGLLWLQGAWQTRSRHVPTRTIDFVDEWSSGLAFRVGDADREGRMSYGSGAEIGVFYLERNGSRGMGLSLAHELDVAWLSD